MVLSNVKNCHTNFKVVYLPDILMMEAISEFFQIIR